MDKRINVDALKVIGVASWGSLSATVDAVRPRRITAASESWWARHGRATRIRKSNSPQFFMRTN